MGSNSAKSEEHDPRVEKVGKFIARVANAYVLNGEKSVHKHQRLGRILPDYRRNGLFFHYIPAKRINPSVESGILDNNALPEDEDKALSWARDNLLNFNKLSEDSQRLIMFGYEQGVINSPFYAAQIVFIPARRVANCSGLMHSCFKEKEIEVLEGASKKTERRLILLVEQTGFEVRIETDMEKKDDFKLPFTFEFVVTGNDSTGELSMSFLHGKFSNDHVADAYVKLINLYELTERLNSLEDEKSKTVCGGSLISNMEKNVIRENYFTRWLNVILTLFKKTAIKGMPEQTLSSKSVGECTEIEIKTLSARITPLINEMFILFKKSTEYEKTKEDQQNQKVKENKGMPEPQKLKKIEPVIEGVKRAFVTLMVVGGCVGIAFLTPLVIGAALVMAGATAPLWAPPLAVLLGTAGLAMLVCTAVGLAGTAGTEMIQNKYNKKLDDSEMALAKAKGYFSATPSGSSPTKLPSSDTNISHSR